MPTNAEATHPQTLDIKEILKILPHRYPFVMIDKITHIDLENNTIVGIKNLTMNEQFFQGHFPNAPLMPGVLMLEALAQTGGILVHLKGYNKIAALLNINNVKFRNPVKPGDTLEMHCQAVHLSSKGGRFKAEGKVNGKLAVQAEIGFALIDESTI